MSQGPDNVDWEDAHRFAPVEAMPWYYPRLDPDIAWAMNLLDARIPSVLDLGTSSGSQAIELARHGLDVVGTDISPVAVAEATRRAREAGVRCQFVVDDVLKSKFTRPFDFIIDRGCLHTLPEGGRSDYVKSILKLLRWHGHLLLKCVSNLAPPMGKVPHRFTPDQIKELFKGTLTLCDMRPAIFYSNVQPPPQALFCIFRRD